MNLYALRLYIVYCMNLVVKHFLRFSYVRRLQKAWKCIIWEAEEKGSERIGKGWGVGMCERGASEAGDKGASRIRARLVRTGHSFYHVRIGWL